MSFFREAAWLTPDRALAFGQLHFLCWAVIVASIPWTAPGMNVARDFAAFWTAGDLTLQGRLADAYGAPGVAAVAALFGPGVYSPFWYPPPALLIWLPFALMPFAVAAALWIAGSGLAYAMAIRKVAGGGLILALAFPSVLICGLYGQNSLFSAALLGAAAVTLGRHPVVAGVLLGCLAYKPQLAMLAPLTLMLAGRWQAFSSAAVTVVTLIAASVLAFGVEPWLAFIGNLPAGKAWFADGVPGYDKFASPYAALRLLGSTDTAAWTVQAIAAVAAILGLIWIARQRPGGAAEVSAMVVTSGLCVPSLGEYDLVILIVPAAWLAAEAARNGWLPYERITLAGLYVMPLAIKVAAMHGVPLAPAAVVTLALLVGRRVNRTRGLIEHQVDNRLGRAMQVIVSMIFLTRKNQRP
jgi:hypothetical protein